MALVNENFLELPQENVFASIRREVEKFKVIHPSYNLIDLSVNDVTHSLGAHVAESMRQAVDEMAHTETFHGYGPEQGYGFLRETIIKNDFNPRGIHLTPEEIFVNDGIKSEIGNIGEILGTDNAVGVADPIYPIYVESNVVSGRAGVFRGGHWSNVNYLECVESNGFVPQPPNRPIDVVYLCSPNNPTGMVFSKSGLKKWVDYALKNNTLILFDATYEAYIQSPGIPHSIYEIRGAKKFFTHGWFHRSSLWLYCHPSRTTDTDTGRSQHLHELIVELSSTHPFQRRFLRHPMCSCCHLHT